CGFASVMGVLFVGSVAFVPGRTFCVSACFCRRAPGTTVAYTLSLHAALPISGWTGCATSSGTSCTVSMTQAQSVIATFTRNIKSSAVNTSEPQAHSTFVTRQVIGYETTCSSTATIAPTATSTAASDDTYSFTP